MLEDYKSALRAGQRAYRARIARGQSPYLAVLDDVLKGVDIVAQEPLGLVEIPSDSLVGTKTSGRHTAFSYDFMPLLEPDTEFAAKWSVLCDAHLEEGIQTPIIAFEYMNRFYVQEGNKRVSVLKYYGAEFAVKWSILCDAHLEEGIHTPIIAFEYMNRFYVQEGNKRVSVLKYYGAVKIPGTVTRLIPARTEDLENKIYYEFLDFYKLSKVNYVHFSKLGGYSKLQTLVCKASGEAWSEDDRLNFAAFYTMFHQQFEALGGTSMGLTTGDALLVYLSVYRYSDTYDATPAQVRQNLEKLWNEVKVLTEPHGVELSLDPPKSPAEPLFHEYNAKISAWVRAHDEGRAALAKVFPDKVYISSYEDVNPEVDAEQVLEEVAHNNADVVFTTSVRMYNACLKVAAQHPKTRILNCSLNAPHPLVRTYYPRTYEVTYLLGMLAGIMTKTGHIGYVAANPVYGVPAAVNAFAQGLKSVRPAGCIKLRWACQTDAAHPLDFADCPEIDMVYARDSREPADTNRDYGLCRKLPDGSLQPLGLPVWRWDTFYVQIVRSIFDGSWDNAATTRAVNYWWGLRSGAEDLEYQEALPSGTRQLLDLMETLQGSDNVHIFPEKLYDNEDNLHSPENRVYSPKELMEMDWLDACVHGKLPHYDELDVKTRTVLAINGLDNVKGLEK